MKPYYKLECLTCWHAIDELNGMFIFALNDYNSHLPFCYASFLFIHYPLKRDTDTKCFISLERLDAEEIKDINIMNYLYWNGET